MLKNRVLTMIVVVLLSVSLLVGCVSGDTTPKTTTTEKEETTSPSTTDLAEPVILKLWAGIPPEYGYGAMVENFNEAFADQNIQLEYTRYVNNKEGNIQLETTLMAGGEIDVFISYGGLNKLKQRIEGGLPLDMTDYLADREFDPFTELGEANMDGYTIDGSIYGMTTKYENTGYIFANVEMFEAVGIPLPVDGWTYEEFREAAQKMTSGEGVDKIYGMFWWLSQGNAFSQSTNSVSNILQEYTIYKDDEGTETNFDHPLWEAGMKLVTDTTLVDGSAPTMGTEISDALAFDNMFLSGKAAMAAGIWNILRLIIHTNYITISLKRTII